MLRVSQVVVMYVT